MTSQELSSLRRAPSGRFAQAWLMARLFFNGPGWSAIWWRILVFAWILLLYPKSVGELMPRSVKIFFGLLCFLPPLAAMTMDSEIAQAPRLAYFQLLPQKRSSSWLVLWPLRFIGIAGAVLFTALDRLPLLALPIVAACAWSNISLGHWLAGPGHGRRSLVLLLAILQPLAIGVIADVSLPAAAIVSTVAALIGLFAARRTWFGRLLAPPADRVHRDDYRRIDRPRRQQGTSYRLLKLALLAPGARRWWWYLVLFSCGITAGMSMMAFDTFAWLQWVVVALTAAGALTKTTEITKVDFIVAQPLSAGRRFAGTVLPWIAMVLIAPAAMALLVKLSVASAPFYNVDGSAYRIFKILGVSSQSFLHTGRQVSVAVTDELLWSLYRNAFRMVFFGLAILFGLPLYSVSRHLTPRLRFVTVGLGLAIVAAVLPYYTVLFGHGPRRLAPLWLAALLATVSGTLFFRLVFFRRPIADVSIWR